MTKIRRIGLAVAMTLAGGCHPTQPNAQAPQVNQAELEAIDREREARHAAWSAGHPKLAGVDLLELHAFGIDPYWSFDIGEAVSPDEKGVRAAIDDEWLGQQTAQLDPRLTPVVRDDRATYSGKNSRGVAFEITVTVADCHAQDDHAPLSAELRIGATVRRGCAGSPFAMRDGWD